ncbi:MAG: LacI family transcriptional regulator [Paracoccaceae bacterium]
MSDSVEKRRNGTERPTLRTIANLTGLAVTTVSRALNDAPDIGQATKEKVRNVAKEVGYRPNRAGVRLRTGKTNVISLVVSSEEHMVNHTAQLVYSISDTLRGTPYHMIVTPFSSEDDPMEAIRYIVETGSADGVIINQIKPQDERVKYMLDHDFPFATHGRTDAGWSHPYFDFDNTAFGELALQKLAARGRKNIVMIAPPFDQNYARHMIDGMHSAAIAANVNVELLQDVFNNSSFSSLEAEIKRVMSQKSPPDGIISSSTAATIAAVTTIESCGMTIGKDVDLVGKEAVPFLGYFRRNIIVVREDVRQAGTFLTEALMRRIRSPQDPPMMNIESPKVADDLG